MDFCLSMKRTKTASSTGMVTFANPRVLPAISRFCTTAGKAVAAVLLHQVLKAGTTPAVGHLMYNAEGPSSLLSPGMGQ